MGIVNKIMKWIDKCSHHRYAKKILGSLIIVFLFAIFLIVGHINSKPVNIADNEDIFRQESNGNEVYKNSENVKNNPSDITVCINGEIKKPGVYKLKNNSRVGDLVKISGGFKDEADTYKINLAKKLKDEDYIYIDKLQNNKENGRNISAEDKSSVSNQGIININTASAEELKTIPGIGDATAQNIIDYREQNGGFSSIEDIKKVDRIGDKTFEKLKDKIDVH